MRVKSVKRRSHRLALKQYGIPRDASLKALQHDELEKFRIVFYKPAPLPVVIYALQFAFLRPVAADFGFLSILQIWLLVRINLRDCSEIWVKQRLLAIKFTPLRFLEI